MRYKHQHHLKCWNCTSSSSPLFYLNFGGVPVAPDRPRWVSEGLKLFGREIILEELQPVWSQYLIVTDRQTDGQTTCSLITALCIASRGKMIMKCNSRQLLVHRTTVIVMKLQICWLEFKLISRYICSGSDSMFSLFTYFICRAVKARWVCGLISMVSAYASSTCTSELIAKITSAEL